jgi:hypothetical protein
MRRSDTEWKPQVAVARDKTAICQADITSSKDAWGSKTDRSIEFLNNVLENDSKGFCGPISDAYQFRR